MAPKEYMGQKRFTRENTGGPFRIWAKVMGGALVARRLKKNIGHASFPKASLAFIAVSLHKNSVRPIY
jgi:hypothetical protein